MELTDMDEKCSTGRGFDLQESLILEYFTEFRVPLFWTPVGNPVLMRKLPEWPCEFGN